MNLAETKKRNNISEYIIHMYQTEDLIRVYEFDIEKINEYVVKHIPAEDKEALSNWYKSVGNKMKEEGIVEKGHLKSVQKIVEELVVMKDDLLKNNKDFKALYIKSKPHIDKSMKLAEGAIKNEIQICLNGVYGLLLLRLNGKKVHPDLMESINAFGNVLSYLSYKYKQQHYMCDN